MISALSIPWRYLQGIDVEEIIGAIHARRADDARQRRPRALRAGPAEPTGGGAARRNRSPAPARTQPLLEIAAARPLPPAWSVPLKRERAACRWPRCRCGATQRSAGTAPLRPKRYAALASTERAPDRTRSLARESERLVAPPSPMVNAGTVGVVGEGPRTDRRNGTTGRWLMVLARSGTLLTLGVSWS
jgi:hypothetical protein